jgi:hypothetical protein
MLQTKPKHTSAISTYKTLLRNVVIWKTQNMQIIINNLNDPSKLKEHRIEGKTPL